MRKLSTAILTIVSAGMMLLGTGLAQQAPASKPKTTPATKAPAAKKAPAKAPTTPATTKANQMQLTTQKEKASYALGMNIAASLQQQAVATEVDPAIVAQGLKDSLSGTKLLLTEQDAQAALMNLQGELRKKMAEQAQAASATNKKEGEAFLAANKTKEGVVTLPSGVQYKIITGGVGPKPTLNDTVVCNYRGTLINGKEFDSSYKRGEPATFPVSGVIKGWTEVLQLMPVGSKWQVFIPSDMAYGDRGAGPDIGPGATLIFDIELLKIQGQDKK